MSARNKIDRMFEFAIPMDGDQGGYKRPELDAFTQAYIQAMLWSTTDESDDSGGEPLDLNYSEKDIAPKFLQQIVLDCTRFQQENGEDIRNGCSRGSYDDYEQAGHDFWLTRAGHGAGFWDGDWENNEVNGVNAGERLTAAANKFSNIDPYVGDDGLIYGA